MKIRDLFSNGGPVFSFEFFPPKTDQGVEHLYQTIERLGELRPSFVSVTYGAGGGTGDRTMDLVVRIKHQLGIESMAHVTCVGAGRGQLTAVLNELRDRGIENVLALRGDPPLEQPALAPAADGFAHASDLVAFIRARSYPFCLAGASYPEGHPECRGDLDADLDHLTIKVNAGVDFLITQLFFDNRDYFAFVDRVRRRGVAVPILPGIMPVLNVAQIERITRLCGARIPEGLHRQLSDARTDDAAAERLGIAHATAQCADLLARGAPGIHFYTLNKSPATRTILQTLRG